MAPKEVGQNITAAKYQQTTSRATPESVRKELKKLTAESGPHEFRKRALHDLAHALAYVQKQHEVKVVEVCKEEDVTALLLSLLDELEKAPPVPAAEDHIRVGRRTLAMGPLESKLYVMSCFVNLSYLGGAGQLRVRTNLPEGNAKSALELFLETLAQTIEAAGGESIMFYTVAGLYNLSNHESFAQATAAYPTTLAKLESLESSPNPDTVKYAAGCIEYWKRHHLTRNSSWPPSEQQRQ